MCFWRFMMTDKFNLIFYLLIFYLLHTIIKNYLNQSHSQIYCSYYAHIKILDNVYIFVKNRVNTKIKFICLLCAIIVQYIVYNVAVHPLSIIPISDLIDIYLNAAKTNPIYNLQFQHLNNSPMVCNVSKYQG